MVKGVSVRRIRRRSRGDGDGAEEQEGNEWCEGSKKMKRCVCCELGEKCDEERKKKMGGNPWLYRRADGGGRVQITKPGSSISSRFW